MTPTNLEAGDGLSRREFAQLAAAVAAAVGLTAGAGADEPPKPAADQPAKPAITPEQATEAIIRERHGKHLTDEQVQKLTRRVLGLRFNADALKRVPLTNGDEPAVTAAIVGGRRPGQLRELIGAADFRLPQEDLQRIERFLQANPA